MKHCFYVAPAKSGSRGEGTAEHPYPTIEEALAASRRVVGERQIVLEPGVYEMAAPLTLTQADKGLVLSGSPDTVLTGAKTLGKLDWAQGKDGIWETALDTERFDRLFADGKEQVLCRYPNLQPGVVPLEGAATPAQVKQRAGQYQNPEGGYVRAIHQAEWGGNSYVIEGKDSASPCGLKLRWVGDNNRGSGYGSAMVVENVREELDAPMEWFYDVQGKRLYWYAPEGTEPIDAVIAVSAATELLCVQGTEDIRIEQITFTQTGRTLFPDSGRSKPYVPLLRGDWCVVRSGAVYLEQAARCTIENCTFTCLGGNGLFCSGYQEGHTIRHNTFAQIGASAIQIVGSPEAVRQPSFWEHSLYPDLKVHQTSVEAPMETGPCGNDYARDILIEENHISGVGLLEKQSAGINLSVASGIRILHNTIHDSARSLINVNDGTFGGHEIGWNDLFDAQRETADHGPFNSWGRDRFWSVPRYNAAGKWGDSLRRYTQDGKTYDITQIDAVATTHIHHNRFYHAPSAAHSWGIDLDDGSSNYEIDHNLVLGIGIKLREGFDRVVHHNLLLDGQLNIHVPYAGANDRVNHNLVCHRNPVATAGCNRKRFRLSGSDLAENYAFAGGQPIRVPSYIPKFVSLKEASCNAGILTLPKEWQSYFDAAYGQTGCACSAPAYQPDFGRAEAAGSVWFLGAKCSTVTQAIRSSTALPDQQGLYVSYVLPFSKAARMGVRQRDVIRSCDGKAAELRGKAPRALVVWRENAELRLAKEK